jgi:spore coat polysaccharide biosynthesis protein SpsF (cytidylyltransferase family)
MNNEDKIPRAILVTARTRSTRLPNKCLLELDEVDNIFTHILKRCKMLDIPTIICTSLDESDNELCSIGDQFGLKYFRGNLENKLERWTTCMNEFNIDIAHLLDADDPFFNPDEVIKSLDYLRSKKLDLVLPSKLSSNGYATVGTSITKNFINELQRRLIHSDINEIDVIPWEILIFEEDRVKILEDNKLIDYYIEMRLTLDYPEDFTLIKILHNKFGSYAKRKNIEEYLVDHMDLVDINIFRNSEFKVRQNSQKLKFKEKLNG